MSLLDAMSDEDLMRETRIKHLCLYNALLKCIYMFERCGINYSLFGGTLLGQLRSNEIVLWDDDIDLVILDEDVHKLESDSFVRGCDEIGMQVIVRYCSNYFKKIDKQGNCPWWSCKAQHFHKIYQFLDWGEGKLSKIKIPNTRKNWEQPVSRWEKTSSTITRMTTQTWWEQTYWKLGILDIMVYKRNRETNLCDYKFWGVDWKWKARRRYIDYDNLGESEYVKFGPINAKQMRNPKLYLDSYISGDYINKSYIIDHFHGPSCHKYVKPLPYTLTDAEVDIVKSFSFNISWDELDTDYMDTSMVEIFKSHTE